MTQSNISSRRRFVKTMAGGGLGMAVPSALLELLKQPVPSAGNQQHDQKFVPVMITPFTSGNGIDYPALASLIDFYLAAGAKGLFANCLSSEMFQLDEQEKLDLVGFVIKQVNGAVPVVASGSFGSTLREQTEFTKKMQARGTDAVILLTNQFGAKEEKDDIVMKNLDTFFSLTGTIRLGTYECPSPYKRILSPAVFRHVVESGRVVYHKDTTLDLAQVKVKLELAGNSGLRLYDAHTPNAAASLRMGARGISAIAGNFYPEIFSWLCKNVNDSEKTQEVDWIQSELTQTDGIISQGYPASAKYFLQKRGLPVTVATRVNKTALTMDQKELLDGVLKSLDRWTERLGIRQAKI